MLCGLKNTKNKCYTEITRASENLFLILDTSFLKKKSRVSESLFERNQKLNLVILSSYSNSREFDSVPLLNSIKLNSWIEFDLVRLKYGSIGFDLLCRIFKSMQLFNHYLAWKMSEIK